MAMRTDLANIWRRHKVPLVIVWLTWGAYFIALFSRILKVRSDGIWAGHVNVWSDWAMHITLANTFAYKSPHDWFAYHPIYAGGKLTYPFFTNFISGMLMRAGMSLTQAFILPSILYCFLLLAGIYFLGYLLLRSKNLAVLSVSLFLLTSSFGFLHFLQDLWAHPSLSLIAYPVKEYSRFNEYDWGSGNIITGLLVPQRAFLLGMTIGLWAVIGVLYALLSKELSDRNKRGLMVIAGIAAGMLPIVHAHGFMALVAISFCIALAFIRRYRLLLWYAIPATALSVALYGIFVYGGIESASFVSWLPGWTAKKGIMSWLTLWFWLSGILLPLAVVGWIVALRGRAAHAYGAASMLLFVAGNLILFQPTRWDNSKLFYWSFLGFSYMASAGIGWLWAKHRMVIRIAVGILIFVLTATGILEAIRVQRIDRNAYVLTSTDDMALGEAIRSGTDPLARFLTAPQHNHPVSVWGVRSILLGYTGWVWNYGFLYQERERDVRTMYLGGERTDALLKKYEVSYVAVGPSERNDLSANEAYFEARYPVAFSNASYRIYDVRGNAKPY